MTKSPISQSLGVNPLAMERATSHQLKEPVLKQMLIIFKAISDETRLKILRLLQFEQLCVGDIALVMKMTKSAVSHQLKYLKNAELIKSQRQGKNIYYSIQDHCVQELIEVTLHHVSEHHK
jgi:Predicted transcriptional regulators